MPHDAVLARVPRRPLTLGWGATSVARTLRRGETLYRAGDPASTSYAIDAGLVKLVVALPSGRERIVGVAGPGDLVGALTPSAQAFGETAEALGAAVVVRALEPRLPEHAAMLARGADTHMAWLRHALEENDLPVAARLARTLVRLGDRFGQRGDDGRVRLTLPLTHEHLAALVGAARETTTATLSELRQRGLLEGTRGRYQFDPARLRDAAHGPLLN
jgi:CRP/FNR family transcriptional regulator, cyclic AMP receptor protein